MVRDFNFLLVSGRDINMTIFGRYKLYIVFLSPFSVRFEENGTQSLHLHPNTSNTHIISPNIHSRIPIKLYKIGLAKFLTVKRGLKCV